jgi:hypothetical protein
VKISWKQSTPSRKSANPGSKASDSMTRRPHQFLTPLPVSRSRAIEIDHPSALEGFEKCAEGLFSGMGRGITGRQPYRGRVEISSIGNRSPSCRTKVLVVKKFLLSEIGQRS